MCLNTRCIELFFVNLILPLHWTSPWVIRPPSAKPLAFAVCFSGKSLKDLASDRPQMSSDAVAEMLSLLPESGGRCCVRSISPQAHLLFPSVQLAQLLTFYLFLSSNVVPIWDTSSLLLRYSQSKKRICHLILRWLSFLSHSQKDFTVRAWGKCMEQIWYSGPWDSLINLWWLKPWILSLWPHNYVWKIPQNFKIKQWTSKQQVGLKGNHRVIRKYFGLNCNKIQPI